MDRFIALAVVLPQLGLTDLEWSHKRVTRLVRDGTIQPTEYSNVGSLAKNTHCLGWFVASDARLGPLFCGKPRARALRFWRRNGAKATV